MKMILNNNIDILINMKTYLINVKIIESSFESLAVFLFSCASIEQNYNVMT